MVDVVTPPNGNGRHGIIDRMSERLVRALPPAFLLLVLLNIAFLGVVAWVFQHNTTVRNEMIQRIIESCLTRPP
jgi:cbb3-type cytochrome oxidase subunit 3